MDNSQLDMENKKPSWVCTLSTLLCLCLALFIAFNMGQPQKPTCRNTSGNNINGGRPIDFYFITVTGGFRPLKHQTHLLKQVANVAKTFKVKFVVNISELGENDPLTQNGTWHFQSLKIPWYTTRASNEQEEGYFLKQFKIAYGKTLDIIGLNTGSSQGLSSGIGNNQLDWLMRTLETSPSNWRIVVGFHPLAVCEENKERIKVNHVYEPLHHTFLKFGVNLCISRQVCTNYTHQGGVAYIGNLGPMDDGSYLSSVNEVPVLKKEMVNELLLHRVSCLEIVTYFVTSAGEVVHKTVLQQRGKEVM